MELVVGRLEIKSMSKLAALISVGLLAFSAQDCFGQYTGGRGAADYILSRPTVSPYLNLTRNVAANSVTTNYHTLVRPQLEARRRAAEQQKSIRRVQSQLSDLSSQRLTASRQQQQQQQRGAVTGHPTGRNYFMHYYPGFQRR